MLASPSMRHRLAALIAVAGLAACGPSTQPPPVAPFTVVEATIPDMQAAMAAGRVTSRELVTQYLTRIATYEDGLNAVIAVNPKALEQAEALDRERAAGKVQRLLTR